MPSEQPPRLDSAVVMRMATAYLTRYSASSQHLRQVLDRKVRRWFRLRPDVSPEDGEVGALVDLVVAQLIERGVLDDTVFALAHARRLVARGLPHTRIRMDLRSRGLAATPETLDEALVPDAATQALRFASRKRLGPFRSGPRAPFRDKDIRSLHRAGFTMREAIAVIGADEDGMVGADQEET